MDLYVKVEAKHCNQLEQTKNIDIPQIRFLQAGERATLLTWDINGSGKISNLNLSSSTLLPITLMARETGSSLSRMRGRLEIRVLFALSLMHVSCGVGFGLGSREA